MTTTTTAAAAAAASSSGGILARTCKLFLLSCRGTYDVTAPPSWEETGLADGMEDVDLVDERGHTTLALF
jgi:hypothetical protein